MIKTRPLILTLVIGLLFLAQSLSLPFARASSESCEESGSRQCCPDGARFCIEWDEEETCDPECAECTQTCSDGECKSTGMTLCNDPHGNDKCVRDPLECTCTEKCDFCTETCDNLSGECGPSGEFMCPDRTCSRGGKCPIECTETCEPCKEECKDGECTSTGKSLCPGTNICVSNQFLCPSKCDPTCDSCTEICNAGFCMGSGNIRCNDVDNTCVQKHEPCPEDFLPGDEIV